MKKFVALMVSVAMLMSLLIIPSYADSAVTPQKSEDFSGTAINGAAFEGTNGLGTSGLTATRTTASIASNGLGGKTEDDKYLLVNRQEEDDTAATPSYYFSLNFGKTDANNYSAPMTISFSAYAPEDLGTDSFFVQLGLSENASPTNQVYFVTDERAVVNDPEQALGTQRFLVNVGEWNRISITMTPNTRNTKVTVNGKSYNFTKASKDYGTYMRSIRIQLPARAGKKDDFSAYDDFAIYNGDITETYTAPADGLTVTDNAALNGDTVTVTGEYSAENITAKAGHKLGVINGENNKPARLAVWEDGNPVPKYYSVSYEAANPSASPTAEPSASPSASPTTEPSASPSASPTAEPSASPSASPSTESLKENFTDAVIDNDAKTLKGTNGLKAEKVNPIRALGSIANAGLGGKKADDKYLVVTRNSQENDENGYYFDIVRKGDDTTKCTGAVTVSFSIYAPEGLEQKAFGVQMGLCAADATSPIGGGVYFVTSENAVVNNAIKALGDQRFLVNAGEWNRVSITMTPNTSNTKVTVNGESFESTILAKSAQYGEYMKILRFQIPRTDNTAEFTAIDDIEIYDGAVTEAYTAPEGVLSVAEGKTTVVVNDVRNTITIDGDASSSDIVVEEGYSFEIVRKDNKAVKLAVWADNYNPVPKYYTVYYTGDELPLVYEKSEDFTGTVINDKEISGTNGLGALSINPQRAKSEVKGEGLGGKNADDKYFLITRNQEVNDNNGYFAGIILPPDGNNHKVPITVAFSVYVPEITGDSTFFVQMGPQDDKDKAPSPVGQVHFVTNSEKANIDKTKALRDQRFLVNAGEWNRIAISMYPGATRTEVVVNGVRTEIRKISGDTKYGEYLRVLLFQLPRTDNAAEFAAIDDIVIYKGTDNEEYTAPMGALNVTGNAELSGDTITVKGDYTSENISVSEGHKLGVINGESNKPERFAVWADGNPVPKYYDVTYKSEGNIDPPTPPEDYTRTLTYDSEAHSFTAKNNAIGSDGVVIVVTYNMDSNIMENITVNEIKDVNGNYEKTYEIENYDGEKLYKAFWWSSLEEMKPYLQSNSLGV